MFYFRDAFSACRTLQLPFSENFRRFVFVGFLGGFSTYSSFMFDVFALLEKGETDDHCKASPHSFLLDLELGSISNLILHQKSWVKPFFLHITSVG